MSYGVTSTGFVAKRLADIKAELEAAYRAAFGAAINLEPQSIFGQQIGIHSEREALIWELAEAVYNARRPDTAEGVNLNDCVSLTNVTRLPATKSVVAVRILGTDGTVIPAGTFIMSVEGNAASRFVSLIGGTIGETTTGLLDLDFEAETAGAVTAPTGTLTVIETPISGVTSAANTADADVGRELETDAQLRIRRLVAMNRPGTATANGIRNAILEVDAVIQANVIENDTNITDTGGRPPHSVQSVVSGGADADIAAAILSAKAGGIQTYGDVSIDVVDSQGMTHEINFSRPSEVPIYLRITVTPNTDPNEGLTYPANGDAAIETAVLAFVEANYVLGHDVVLSQFYTPINTIDGVIGILVEASLNGSSWVTTNLPIAANELATFDSARVTVVS